MHAPWTRARRLVGVLAAAMLAATACARPPKGATAAALTVVDTLWYVSARARVAGRDSRELADSLEYGIAVFTRPELRDPYTDRVTVTLVDSARLTAGEFSASLRARTRGAPSPRDFAVLYVHGFGTSLHEAWNYAAIARARTGSSAPWIAFSWPSNGSGLAAPRLGELFSRAYRDDSAAAASSRPAFARALRAVIGATSAARLVVAPHSLGGQVVGESLAEDDSLRVLLGATRLRAVAFIAPDIESRRFAEYTVPAVQPLARRVLLYTSAHDRVLALSRNISNSQRAGLYEGSPLVREGLETVDVTEGVSAGGWLQRIFGTHHAIRRASGTLFDLAGVVGTERIAECRDALGTGTRGLDQVWRLTSIAPSLVALDERCPTRTPR